MRWDRCFHKSAWGALLVGWPMAMVGGFLPNAAIATAGVWVMLFSLGIAIASVFAEFMIQRSFRYAERAIERSLPHEED